MLLTGIEGVGKRTAAMVFAMACNCTVIRDNGFEFAENPCEACSACNKIRSGIHPDIIHIQASGNFIRIDQIRSLWHTLSMKPYEARMRVVIISNAQVLNPEAGNALLKALEEPPARTIFILTALQTSDLLPTIVSRCRHIRFQPLPPEDLVGILTEKKHLEPEHADVIAAMAGGSVSNALAMADSDWLVHRNWLIREVEALPERPLNLLMAFAVKLAENKKQLVNNLDIIKSWLRDLMVFKYSPDTVFNRDLMEKIRMCSTRFSDGLLISNIEAIEAVRKSMTSNANVRLALDNLVLHLAGYGVEPGRPGV